MKKVFNIIKKVFNIVLTIFVIMFVLVVCMQRFSNNELSFFDIRMFTVVTRSMEPVYKVGDVLISRDMDPDNIKVGEDITYIGRSGSFAGKVVTHRVVRIEKDANNNLVFHTKGLGNIVEDPIVYEDQLYGKVIYKTKVLSFIYKKIATRMGMFIFVIVPILYIIGSEMIYFMLNNEEKRREKLVEIENKEKSKNQKTKKKKSKNEDEE